MLSGAEADTLVRCGGDDLLIIDRTEPAECQVLADQLRELGDWLECVAGIDSVVVQFDAATLGVDEARRRIKEVLLSPQAISDRRDELVEVPVCYGGEFGPDLDDLCTQLDLSRAELIALHTGREYRVDMLGFTPGFAYIGGLDDTLNAPRLREPRVQVAAGSVGIADGRTGLYALAGPGGWPLIGRTALPLFDPFAEEPFRLRAGMRVMFKAIGQKEYAAMSES